MHEFLHIHDEQPALYGAVFCMPVELLMTCQKKPSPSLLIECVNIIIYTYLMLYGNCSVLSEHQSNHLLH